MKHHKMTPSGGRRSQPLALDLQASRLKDALRHLLKLKGKTYGDVAELLDCSLATVKRIMTQEELSLSRLLAICTWLGISLAELDAAQSLANSADATFTDEQELFLSADPRYLVYMYELWDGMTPEAIATKFGLKTRSTQRYLLKLEQLGLIRVTEKGRVVPEHAKQPNWNSHGALARTNFERLLSAFMDFFKMRAKKRFAGEGDATIPGRIVARVQHGAMSLETYEAMLKDMDEVQRRYEDLSDLEGKIRPKSELGSYAKLVCQAWLLPGENAFELDHVFGTVTDL